MKPNLPRRAAAEFIGTAFLLAAIIGSGIMGERLAAGNTAVTLLANSLAVGAALVALILAFEKISGAHFNPAVTASAALAGEFPWRETPLYFLAQILGAFAGVGAANAMFDLPVFFASTKMRAGSSQLLSEFIATFGLLAVIWGCARLLAAGHSVCRRGIYFGGVLVHRFHFICQSGGHAGAKYERYLCRNSPGRCAAFYCRSIWRGRFCNVAISLAVA